MAHNVEKWSTGLLFLCGSKRDLQHACEVFDYRLRINRSRWSRRNRRAICHAVDSLDHRVLHDERLLFRGVK